LALLASALIPVVSCKVENTATLTQRVTQIVGYSESLNSKTALASDGETINWMPKDSVNVFAAGLNAKFVCTNDAPSSAARFSGEMTIILTGYDVYKQVAFFGAYPYSSENKVEDGAIIMNVPAKQKAVEDSYDPAAFPSIALSAETIMYFSNVCGGISFTLENSGINKIVLSGASNETLAGKTKFGFNEAGVASSFTVLQPETEITLSAPDGECFKTDCRYYIATLPVEFAQGFKISFKKADSEGSKTLPDKIQIFRDQFLNYDMIDNGVEFK